MSWFKDNLWPAWFWNRWYANLHEAYENGYFDGMGQKGHNDLVVSVRKQTKEDIIKLLESGKHVVQFEFESRVFKSAWKQKCRCGYYGVFNEHLIALIKGEK